MPSLNHLGKVQMARSEKIAELVSLVQTSLSEEMRGPDCAPINTTDNKKLPSKYRLFPRLRPQGWSDGRSTRQLE